MKIKIEPYSPKHQSAIEEIYCHTLKNEWEVLADLSQLKSDLAESFQEETVLIASHNEAILGFISWYEPDAFIHHLYIDKQYRDKGVGKELIQCALNRLRYPVRLKCLQKNKKALDFYFSQSWYLVGEGSSEEGDFFLMEYSKIENKKAKMENFSIHERLLKDSYYLGKLPYAHLLLMKNAEVPWFILVPETSKIEIHDLDHEAQKKLFQEVTEVSLMLKNVLKVDKVNMGAIGNIVPQMHFHVVGRRINDFCWPKVVWGAEGFREYKEEELHNMVGLVKSAFGNRLIQSH